MKDITISKKIDDKYQAMITFKEGWKVGFSPAFKKELVAWFKSPEENWLNFNLKEWASTATSEPTAHDTAKQNAYQPAPQPIEDTITF